MAPQVRFLPVTKRIDLYLGGHEPVAAAEVSNGVFVEVTGIAHLERPEINDLLAQARDFDLGITGPPLSASLPRIACTTGPRARSLNRRSNSSRAARQHGAGETSARCETRPGCASAYSSVRSDFGSIA